MLFSLAWLKQICPVDEDERAICSTLTARGLTVDSVQPRDGDSMLEIDIPANRPDCLGHLGVARELGAAFGAPLSEVAAAAGGSGEPVEREVAVEIRDPALCPRYTARLVRGVKIGPSPAWVRSRLESCGLRSVSNAVDASNLVLLELGQPIHFFDHARIAADGGRQIVVRTASSAETLTTLDGVERVLQPEMLVIADARRAVAVAGVIGGADTEIRDSTTEILIEAAHFHPASVRATARRLGIQTDAAFRFERGVDPEAPAAAQELAVRLLGEIAGGEPAPGLLDAYPGRRATRTLTLRCDQVRRLLGYQPETDVIHRALTALRLDPATPENGSIRITVPSYRVDLDREADLVEEVARHLGYDRIPAVRADPAQTVTLDSERPPHELARDLLVHQGFQEALGYSMIAEGADRRFVRDEARAPIGLINPIAEPLSHLRRSVLPGLMRAADLNLRRGIKDVRLFEVGRVFLATDEFPDEPMRLGLAWSGAAGPRHWSAEDRLVDLTDVMGLVELVLDAMQPPGELRRTAGGPEALHPGRSAVWQLPSGELVAWAGALHPELQQDFDQPLFLAEVDLQPLTGRRSVPKQHVALPRVPAVTRDLAVVLGAEVCFATVLEALREVGAPAPAAFEAVDRYSGPPLDAGEASLTIRVTLQPIDRTLTDPEVESYRKNLMGRLSDGLGLRLR